MQRINNLVHKLAGSALNAASLALVAGLLATSQTAFAQCSFDWGTNPVYASPGQFSSLGMLGIYPGTYPVGYEQSGDFTIQNLGVTGNAPGTSWPNSGNITFYASSPPWNDLGLVGVVPSTATNGQQAQVTMTVNSWCSQTVTVVVQGNPCSQKVTEWNGTALTATLDSGTGYCKIEPVPTGASGPFIWNNAYYVNAYKTTTCLAGTWDGANCWYMVQPPGGTLWQNSFFVPTTTPGGTVCSLGTYDASTGNCLVMTAPWGTQAFQWGTPLSWYFTPLMTCPVAGAWDGAHCYIMTAPTGTKAILSNNTFYYQ